MGTAVTAPDAVCLLDVAVLPRVDIMGPLVIKHGGPHHTKGLQSPCRDRKREEGEQVLMPAA